MEKKQIFRFLIISAVLLSLLVGISTPYQARAATTDTKYGSASKDAYAESGYAGTTTGNQQNLYMGYDTWYNKYRTRIYISFNLPSLPANTQVDSAQVEIYQYAVECSGSYGVTAYEIASGWDEYGLTWNNQPSKGGSVGSTTFGCSNGWKSIDITSLVKNWYQGASNNGITIWANSEYNAGGIFRSRECSTSQCPGQEHPRLKVNYSTAPTPTPSPTHTPSSTSTPTPSPTLTPQPSPWNTAWLTDTDLEGEHTTSTDIIRYFFQQQNSCLASPVQDVDGVMIDIPQLIHNAAVSYHINPKVIIATMQKEQSAVTQCPTGGTLSLLMGAGVASTAREQIDFGTSLFRAYQDELNSTGQTRSGWKVGVAKQTQDGVWVTPATKAIAGQFTYTPYAGQNWTGNEPSIGGVWLFWNAWHTLFHFNQPLPNPYAQDTTSPNGNLTAPSHNSTVGPGAVYIAADAWDNSGGTGVKRVEFWVRYSNHWHKAKYDYTVPYSVNWHIPDGLTAQDIEIGIHVVDNAGNVAIDPGGKRTIHYVAPDTTKPDANITSPANGITVYPGSLHLKADAWDNSGGSGVNRVEFWARYNGTWHNVKTEYAAPYDTHWNIPASLQAQDIEIGLHVVDNAGNMATDPGGKRIIHYRRLSHDRTKPGGRITSPDNNVTVGPGKLHLEADAWDNAGGSGVKRVEFWIKYNGSWHRVRDEYHAPYSYDWQIPSGLVSQKLEIGTHIIDRAGNMAIDSGGKRVVNYRRTVSWPAPYIHQLWSTDPNFNGSSSCGPSSLGMLLAWYRKLTPREPWGTKDGFKSPYSWYVTHGFTPFTSRKAPDASCKGAYAGLHGQTGAHTGCGYYSDWHRIGGGVSAMGLSVVKNGIWNYRNDLTKQRLINLVTSGRPTVISTNLCWYDHVVLVRGYDSNSGKFIVSDPYGYCNGKYHGYDIYNKAYSVKYSWGRLRPKPYYVKMKDPIPGGVGMLTEQARLSTQSQYNLMASASSSQTLLMFSEIGEPQPFYNQLVSFNRQDGQLQAEIPESMPPGFYDVAVKPPRRLAAIQSAAVYSPSLALDFSADTFALGDVDEAGGDNVINIFDAAALLSHWEEITSTNPQAQQFDLNDDGIVDDSDLILLSEHYGQQGEGAVGIWATPALNDAILLRLQPQTTTHTVGDIFTVDIYLDAPTTTYGADIVLHYNPTFLTVQDANVAQPGTQITPNNTVYPINQRNEVDTSNGIILFSSHSQPNALPNSGGLLGTVTFQALASTKETKITFDFLPGFTNDSNVVTTDLTGDSLADVYSGAVRIDGVDTLPPTGTLALNYGQEYIDQTQIPFTLAVEDAYSEVTELRTSDDGIIWGEWITFTHEFIGDVPDGDGEKTAYVEVKDASSNTLTLSDTVILDTMPPTGTIYLADVLETRSLIYQIIPDNAQEIAKMLVSQDPLFAGAEWTDFLGENQVALLEKGSTLYVRLMDKAGNVSRDITLDALVADFIAAPLCGIAPVTVDFVDNSTGDISSWRWDFGDEGSSLEQNPSHTYESTGVYSVSLAINGPISSDTLTRTHHIHVTADGTCNTAGLTIINQGTTVTFDGDLETFTLTHGISTTFNNLQVGTYNLVENTDTLVKDNWYLAGVSCEDQNQEWSPIVVDYETFRVDIPIQLSQHLTCTFTHEREEDSSPLVYLPMIIK